MNSLRGRLTLSYAVFAAAVLALLSLLACGVGFELSARTTLEALARSAARAENVASLGAVGGDHDRVGRVIAAASIPGVLVFAPARARWPPGEPGAHGFGPPERWLRPGTPAGPPANGIRRPPPDRPPAEGFHPGARDHGLADSMVIRTVVAPLLGLTMRTLVVGGVTIVIGPDFDRLEPLFHEFSWLLLGSLAISMVLAWAIAAWLANAALEPLIALTRELERFAAGDFATRLVSTSEGGELGALIAAYNGAAAQVTNAFRERSEVELHTRRFLADAGHELRTPLTVIRGYLEILRKGGIDEPSMRERALAMVTAEAQRMRVLVDKLLTLARLERPEVAEHVQVDVGDVVEAAVEHVRAARGGDIALVCPTSAVVLGDPAELAEAVENLVDNAVKYGERSPILVRVDLSENNVVVRVKDGGPGIAERDRARLFERFFRGDDRGEIEGSGLGLAIAQRAIARCGGRIALEDGRPGATTFAITLPSAITRAGAMQPMRL